MVWGMVQEVQVRVESTALAVVNGHPPPVSLLQPKCSSAINPRVTIDSGMVPTGLLPVRSMVPTLRSVGLIS